MQHVLSAYEQLGVRYLDYRQKLRSEGSVRLFLQYVPKHASILDIGCGAGIPVDNILVKHGHFVTGFDLSPTLIKQARRLVPGADYTVRDMRTLKPKEYSVSAIVCLYALFHVPRVEHATLLSTFASFLPPGGVLLLSMGDIPYEGTHEMYGVMSYSSQWGTIKNRTLLAAAGFRIQNETLAMSAGERHQIILAIKK
jgi:trans-aconitate methyltransferase